MLLLFYSQKKNYFFSFKIITLTNMLSTQEILKKISEEIFEYNFTSLSVSMWYIILLLSNKKSTDFTILNFEKL